MKKIAIVLSAVIFCSFVSCGNDDRGDGTGHMYNAALNGNPSSLDPQFAFDESSNTVIKNMYSGLMQTDGSGNVSCCNAESYTVSDDGLIYTFRLKDDNYWFFDKNGNDIIEEGEFFRVTAKDYEFALKRVLDPKMKSPYAEDFLCILGASEIITGVADVSTAEVLAVDNDTLMIVLERPNIEFLSLMASPASYPCNEKFFNSTKGRYGLDDKSVMSNGAFYVRQWFYDPYGRNNILYMKRNDKNWSDSFEICPSFLSFSIERNESDIRELFKNKEIECMNTMNTNQFNSDRYTINGYSAVTLGLIFNRDDENFSNGNLRKALALSVDRDSFSGDVNGDLRIAWGIIPPDMKFHGRSYRELVSDRQFVSYDEEEAAKCFNAAKKELKKESFDSVKILVNAEVVNSEYLHTISKKWQELFGLYIGVEGVTEAEFYERIENGDYSIALYPLKADSPNGLSVMRKFEKVDCLRGIVPPDKLSPQLMTCSSLTSLVEAYTAAEKAIIDTFMFIPLFYKNSYLVMYNDNEDIVFDPFSGATDYRLAQNYD